MSSSAESSVVVSLTELMRAEEARIFAEEERERQRAREGVAAREAEQRASREEEATRVAEEAERRRLLAMREREEAARLDAIRSAAIERARLEAKPQGVIALRLDGPRVDTLRRQLRGTVAALGISLVAWALSLAGVFLWQSHRSDLRAWELARQYGAAEQAATATRGGLEERLRGAAAALAAAEGEIHRLQKTLLDVKKPAEPKPVVAAPPRPLVDEPCPPCPEGDPLCSDLRCNKPAARVRH